MNAMELLTGSFAQAIGWALLHLLWQATLVAGLLAAVLALMSRQSASARYVAACGALALVFAMFVATAIRAYDPAATPVASTGAPASSVNVPLTHLPVLIAESAADGVRDRVVAMAAAARAKLPSIVAVWLAGVVLLSSRLLVSWIQARRLVHRAARPATREWQRAAHRLSRALGLRRAVTLLESAAVEVPSVIGSLRPVILLPASALTGMTPEQIEMVLAHELAHIRRHDFVVNLLQAVVETLMFYHPAVWWMSRRVRIERENCCDDLAVGVCGNPVQYARALARLEELRSDPFSIAVAANGGSLLDRVRRLMVGRAEGTTASSRWAAAVVMLSILVIAIAVPSLPALAERQEQKKAEAAKQAGASVEVVEPREETVEADEDVDLDPGVDVDVDVDVDSPVAVDDPEYGMFTPVPPVPPVPAVAPMAFPTPLATPFPAIAPMAFPHPVPAPFPAIAPVARVGMTPPVPAAPPTPMTPVAMAAFPGHDFDFDFDYEFEYGDDQEQDRELGAGGKLTVDELIALRASNVTPQYVDQMRSVFPGLTLRQVTGLSSLEVTPDFVTQMRSAGLDVKSAREATSLKAVGVTPEFVREMRAAGFEVKSAKDASSLKAVGVTPEFVREMRAAGFEVKTARDASSLKAVGVTPAYVAEMRAAGFEVKTARDASSLRAVGVTPEWLRDMRAAGVKITTARDATSLRAQNVTPEFVKRLAAAGYTNLTARELSRLAAAGVDEDFIREMDQYRKKN